MSNESSGSGRQSRAITEYYNKLSEYSGVLHKKLGGEEADINACHLIYYHIASI